MALRKEKSLVAKSRFELQRPLFEGAYFVVQSSKPVFQPRPSFPQFICTVTCTMQSYSSAAARNQAPILEVLQRVLPATGHFLEIASGTGQHVVAFAAAMPGWQFHPTDPDAKSRTSIDAWIAAAKVDNVRKARNLDASTWPWPVTDADAMFACNMVHISPWDATVGLFRGAAKALRNGGTLVLYGPYYIDGKTAKSNIRFSKSLQQENPAWGVRELRSVQDLAKEHGLSLVEIVPMPANNHCVVFRKPNNSS